MSLVAKEPSGGGEYKSIPAKAYMATCVRVIDFGTQFVPDFDDKTKTTQKPIIGLTFELPSLIMKDRDGNEAPALITLELTLSLAESSNMFKYLKAWRGAPFTAEERAGGFDIRKLLGKSCTAQVESNKNGYPKVTGILGLVEGTVPPPPYHELFVYEIEQGVEGHFLKLPKFQQEKILKSVEMLRTHHPEVAANSSVAVASQNEVEPTATNDAASVLANPESVNDPSSPNFVPKGALPF